MNTKPPCSLPPAPELNFVDSYKYNIAAYVLAELIGIDDMCRFMSSASGGAIPVR